MKYLVIEIQVHADGQVGNIVTAYDDRNTAESAYHSILSSAAVSELACHSALIVTEEAQVIAGARYKHEQPTPEPDGE